MQVIASFRRNLILAAFITLCLMLQACGSINRTRYYEPAIAIDGSLQGQWGDGLAVAVPTHCMWLDVDPRDDVMMWGGPLFLPVFPMGAATEPIEGPYEQGSSVFVDLLLIPNSGTEGTAFSLNPEVITMDFDNGKSLQPDYFFAPSMPEWELRSLSEWGDPGEPTARMGPSDQGDMEGQFEIDGWLRIAMRFTRPATEVHPTAFRIREFHLPDGSVVDYEFALRFVEKRRYVRAGEWRNNEPLWETASGACLELMGEGGFL